MGPRFILIGCGRKGTTLLDGGTHFPQFSHFIDLVNRVFGEIINAIGYRYDSSHQALKEFEDYGVAIPVGSGIVGSIRYTTTAHDENLESSPTAFRKKGVVKIYPHSPLPLVEDPK